jgi:hypothetical protein
MNDEELLSEDPVMNRILKQEEYLRENYTENDFLNNGKTREILFNNFMEKFDRKLANQVELFYEKERCEMVNSVSNMFYYDTQGHFVSELKGIILSHIKPKYDLEILYESPHLASHMINENYNNKAIKVKEDVIIEKKEKVAADFNWAKNI